jgi:hypothetical protein
VTRSASGKRLHFDHGVDIRECLFYEYRQKGYSVMGAWLESRDCLYWRLTGSNCASCMPCVGRTQSAD